MSDTLPKDCPFCGADKVEICRTNKNACWVRCAECGADAQSAKTREVAITNWNRRNGIGHTSSIVDDDDREYSATDRLGAPENVMRGRD